MRQNQVKQGEQQRQQINIERDLILLESICYGSVFEEPSDEMTEEEIKRIISNNKNRLEKNKKLAYEGEIEVLYIKEKDEFLNANKEERKKLESIYHFEQRMLNVKHKHCKNCHQVRIGMKKNKKNICTICADNPELYTEKNEALPIWFNKNGRSSSLGFKYNNTARLNFL